MTSNTNLYRLFCGIVTHKLRSGHWHMNLDSGMNLYKCIFSTIPCMGSLLHHGTNPCCCFGRVHVLHDNIICRSIIAVLWGTWEVYIMFSSSSERHHKRKSAIAHLVMVYTDSVNCSVHAQL